MLIFLFGSLTIFLTRRYITRYVNELIWITEEIIIDSYIQNTKDSVVTAKDLSSQVADAAQQVADTIASQSTKVQDITNYLENTYKIAKIAEKSNKGRELAINAEKEAEEGMKNRNAVEITQEIASVIDELAKTIDALGEELWIVDVANAVENMP